MDVLVLSAKIPFTKLRHSKKYNIHNYHKRNDKHWFDKQNVKLTSPIAVVYSAIMCLQAESQNQFLPCKQIVTKAIDATTLMCLVHHPMKHEGRDRLRLALSENYQGFCEQDH